jgi:threonine/homoserine/homoserine lactone efflux protein
MLSLLTIFVGSFVVGLSGAMAPGPVLTVTISETLKRGFKAGPLIVLGHAILEIVLLTLIGLGLGPFFEHPTVVLVFMSAGGVVLLWMGSQMLLANKRIATEALNASGTPSPYGPVLAGIILSVSNPYWIIWWVTIGMGFVTQSLQYGLIGLLCFYCGHILSDLAWFSFVSFSVSAGRRLCPPMVYRVLFILCGTILVILGSVFIIKVIQ